MLELLLCVLAGAVRRLNPFRGSLDPRGFYSILTSRFSMDKVIVAVSRHCEKRSTGLAMTEGQSGR